VLLQVSKTNIVGKHNLFIKSLLTYCDHVFKDVLCNLRKLALKLSKFYKNSKKT
jgi:hypothetical protein